MHFYILNCGIAEDSMKLIQKKVCSYNSFVEFIPVDTDHFNANSNIRITSEWPITILARLFLQDYLPKHVKKALYLDCDTIILKDIDSIWNTDLSHYMIAGVKDAMDDRYKHLINLLPTDIYINSGVVLYSLDKIREERILLSGRLNDASSSTLFGADSQMVA